jgi:endonuclease-3
MAATAQQKRRAAKIARRLGQHYPNATCSLNFQTPLELLVATILSAQCTDTRVNEVTQTLFGKYPTAAHYAQAPPAQLERDIQSTGFFRNKAKSIQASCRTLLERYGGEVPRDIEALVELPGVGRKTANVVLGTAYHLATGVVVDTHVARISRRLGLTHEKNPEKIERDLIGQFAASEWIALSHRMIHHGRRYCTARKPKCEGCPLLELCPRIGVEEE